jgi:predicted molibdopterin-dependent oxidoreductase YjgC
MVIGANPVRGASGVRLAHEEAHAPGREADRARSAPHRDGDLGACQGRTYHLPLKPGTNVAVVTALAHVIVTEGSTTRPSSASAATGPSSRTGPTSSLSRSPEAIEKLLRRAGRNVRGAARLYATGGNGAIYYGLGVTEHSQGSTTVMAIANLAMATGNIGRPGVGVNPLRGQNNVQGSCDMGSFPHELPGYRHISGDAVRDIFETLWGVKLDNEPGLRIPNMLDAAVEGTFKGIYIQGEDILQSDPDTKHVSAGLARWNASSCTTCSSTRRRTTRMSSCRARPSSRRTAPSPMPSAASSACAR